MRRSIAVIILLLAGSAQARAPSTPDRLLAGRTARAPVQCINKNRIIDTQTFDDGSIFYRMSAKDDYLQRPRNCRQLNSNRSYVTATQGAQLCAGDGLDVFDPVIKSTYGACIFDEFVPYPKKK